MLGTRFFLFRAKNNGMLGITKDWAGLAVNRLVIALPLLLAVVAAAVVYVKSCSLGCCFCTSARIGWGSISLDRVVQTNDCQPLGYLQGPLFWIISETFACHQKASLVQSLFVLAHKS